MNRNTDMYSDRRRLRDLLVEQYQHADDLDAFIMDHFLRVYRAFGAGWSRQQKVNLLLDLIEPAKIYSALGTSQPPDSEAASQLPVSLLRPAEVDDGDLYTALTNGAAEVAVALRTEERPRIIPIRRLQINQHFDWKIATPAQSYTLRITGQRMLRATAEQGVLHDSGRSGAVKLDAVGTRRVIYRCRASRQQIELHIALGTTMGDATQFDLGQRCALTLQRRVTGIVCALMARSANNEQALMVIFVGDDVRAG